MCAAEYTIYSYYAPKYTCCSLWLFQGYSLKLDGGPWYEKNKAGAKAPVAPPNKAEELDRIKQQEQELLNEALYVVSIVLWL
jgi:hypothetical protein